MAAISLDSLPAELLPASSRNVTTGSYINFQDAAFDAWTQQYLPDLYEDEVERYGDRSVASLLRMVGAEMPLMSDQVIWTEQTRLHLSYDSVTVGADTAGANTITINDTGGHALRVGQTVLITDGTDFLRARVTAGIETSTTTAVVECYTNSTGLVDAGLPTTANACDLFVFGSEFGKGTAGMDESINPEVNTFSNKPIILKDNYTVSGSDAAQIGWIEVSGENGQSGYLWYLKAEGDTRTRFEDYTEMALLEAVEATNTGMTGGVTGTEGYFAALESRGIVASDLFDAAADFISDMDTLLQELDKGGAIEENMLYLNRAASLAVDGGIATANSYGSGGTSYGIFDNDVNMALNLGFDGFRRGSYDFYKSDWKYLNDQATRGLVGEIQGTLIPAGSTSVYDQMLGKNIRRPFLHVRYRASEADNRKLKSWVTGSVGGARTSDIDEMRIDFLSERCLVTQAANNFALFKA